MSLNSVSSEIREIVELADYAVGPLRKIASLLPDDETVLDAWLEEAVMSTDARMFTFLVTAALGSERRVDSRHLVDGAILFTDGMTFGSVAWQSQGPLADHLMAAIKKHRLLLGVQLVAIFVVAAWCHQHCDGKIPHELITEARLLARVKGRQLEETGLLMAVGLLTQDEGLYTILGTPESEKRHELSDAMYKTTIEQLSQPLFDRFAAVPRVVAKGYTMRRAVERIGRNDPCPCNGGKKYKKCCYDKDQERLHHSSAIPGKTVQDLRAEPEPFLTEYWLHTLAPHELASLDVLKIDPYLHAQYFLLLGAYSLYDAAFDAMEKLGYSEEQTASLENLAMIAAKDLRKDIIDRVLQVHPEPAEYERYMPLLVAFVQAQDDPATLMALLDRTATQCLETEDSARLQDFAFTLLMSKLRSLGILVARGLIQTIEKSDAALLYDALLEARDRMQLSPEDPIGDILEKRLTEEVAEDDRDTKELQEAQSRLAAKAAEVRQLHEALEKLRKEVERREKVRPEVPSVRPAKATVSEQRTLEELRFKVGELKSMLKERHEERATLRRELREAHTVLDEVRKESRSAPEIERESGEEEIHLLPEEPAGQHPVRLIEFPRKFHETLTKWPPHIARTTMTLLGRLAAGEPTAYVGVVRLKACPDIYRQRIGSDYRLLFRLLPDRVQVVDLINRRDLERRIKELLTVRA